MFMGKSGLDSGTVFLMGFKLRIYAMIL